MNFKTLLNLYTGSSSAWIVAKSWNMDTALDWESYTREYLGGGAGWLLSDPEGLSNADFIGPWDQFDFQFWLPHYVIMWVCARAPLLHPYRGVILKTSVVVSSSKKQIFPVRRKLKSLVVLYYYGLAKYWW